MHYLLIVFREVTVCRGTFLCLIRHRWYLSGEEEQNSRKSSVFTPLGKKVKVCIQAKWLTRSDLISSFCRIKRLGVYLLPLEGMLVHHRVTPGITGTHVYPFMERGTVVPCPRLQSSVPSQGLNPDRSIMKRAHLPWSHRAFTIMNFLLQTMLIIYIQIELEFGKVGFGD